MGVAVQHRAFKKYPISICGVAKSPSKFHTMKATFLVLALCVLLGLSQAFPYALPEADAEPSRRRYFGGYGYGGWGGYRPWGYGGGYGGFGGGYRGFGGGYTHSHAGGPLPHSHGHNHYCGI